MKIKNKLALAIISAFILNNILLLGYYELFLSKKLSNELDNRQNNLDNIVEYIDIKSEDKSSINEIKEIIYNIDEIKDEGQYFLEIKDSKGHVLLEKGQKNKGSLNMTSSEIISINGENYLLRVIQVIPINDVEIVPIYISIVKAEIVILGGILIALMTIIYIKLVNPILNLIKDIENYKYGIKPVKCHRCDEIGWLKNNFVELTEQLDEEKENQNRIIASISHDIKTPLTSIMGYAERMKNKSLPEERQKKYIDIMYSKSQDIKGLIDEFDDYLSYNLESSSKKEKIRIKKLVNLINEEYEDELNQLNIDFYIESDCDEDFIDIDLSKIRRVFGNIIGNSIKNMNSVKKEIIVTFEDFDENIVVSISDSGKGVNKEELDKIFEALYTSDKSRKVAGLGLSICKSAIEGHGGKIWAENNNIGGLTIKFTLMKI
ncbi:sensor histidine kinase [Romboutsia ilealis]|uniref:histidine kinase n=1 Tax=Romboutsia faecis TaxID=2764597 RepID=A0ABR7JPL2_9FIRM|nr:HAMP domain-containing sensor histidine kinase [Romboutsia faecis]MBC5996843.1 HAMP domain-containing histidine kinase [Romboutsia faecis]MRN24652.1 sensor histidine kinase [Romboutsia ilealis]